MLFSVRWIGSHSFVTGAGTRKIHAHQSHTDGPTPSPLDLLDLAHQVTDHAVNLFDHRFRQDLGLGPDFNGSDRPAGYQETGDARGGSFRDNLSERSVPASPEFSHGPILGIEDAFLRLHTGAELGGFSEKNQVFVEMGRNLVTEA